jgi:hypothetical protein
MIVKKAPERSRKFCFAIRPSPISFTRDTGKVYFLVADNEYVRFPVLSSFLLL